MNKGLVIKNTGSWFYVRTNQGTDVQCKLRGTFRLKDIKTTNPIAVGDKVVYEMNDDGTGLITEIEKRKNYVIRRSSNLSKQAHIIAANVDLSFLVVTINEPETSTVFIDRFLASAEAYRVPVCLVFNKIDLYDDEDMEYINGLVKLYEYIGYQCVKVSSVTGEEINELKEKIKNKITLFSGHSGVGKSTLINSLVPGIALKTGGISEYHNRGMHTTTFSEMVDVPTGGYIIDTPGIKGFGMVDMKKDEIAHYFPEIFEFSKSCRFNNCQHINEPNCAVLEALEKHQISESRYKSYLNIMEDGEEDKYR